MPTSGGSSERETSEDTVTPIRSPSLSIASTDTPCGQRRISSRSSLPPAIVRSYGRVVDRAAGAWCRVRPVRLDVFEVTRLLLDAREPCANVRVGSQVDSGFVRAMRVAVERDVGDRVAAADEEVP